MPVTLALSDFVAAPPANCPLCQHDHLAFFHQDSKRSYYQCLQCKLVTVPSQFFLTSLAEKTFYDLHDNTVADEGYQRFLSRTLTPVLAAVSPNAVGLDFGCGEGAVLSQMAAKHGVKVDNYDLYYHPNNGQLAQHYDFVTMTEVIEHIADARQVFNLLSQLVKAGGLLAIMTKRVHDHAGFIHWHYKHDPTHINFYSIDTFEWLANHYHWRLEVVDNDVVFFHC